MEMWRTCNASWMPGGCVQTADSLSRWRDNKCKCGPQVAIVTEPQFDRSTRPVVSELAPAALMKAHRHYDRASMDLWSRLEEPQVHQIRSQGLMASASFKPNPFPQRARRSYSDVLLLLQSGDAAQKTQDGLPSSIHETTHYDDAAAASKHSFLDTQTDPVLHEMRMLKGHKTSPTLCHIEDKELQLQRSNMVKKSFGRPFARGQDDAAPACDGARHLVLAESAAYHTDVPMHTLTMNSLDRDTRSTLALKNKGVHAVLVHVIAATVVQELIAMSQLASQ